MNAAARKSQKEQFGPAQASNRHQKARKLAAGLLLASAFVLLALAPPIPPPEPPPSENQKEEGKGLNGNGSSRFPELPCQCSRSPRGYRCEQISGFRDYEWTHGRSVQFARSIVDLAQRLPEGRFAMAIEGVADSKTIYRFKSWSEVNPKQVALECRGRQGNITNEDLALLRACTIATEIERYNPKPIKVKVLEPVAYMPSDHKVGDAYKAAVIYLPGDNGGCR